MGFIRKYFISKNKTFLFYDATLLWAIIGLMSISVVMVLSASMPVAQFLGYDAFLYSKRHVVYLGIGIFAMVICLQLPSIFWQKTDCFILMFAVLLLVYAIFLGHSVQGATRWISLGLFKFQPSELAKFAYFIYLANYLERKTPKVRDHFWGFCKPLLVVILLAVILLTQPDFGSVVLLFITASITLFIAGARIRQFFVLTLLGTTGLTLLIYFEPYRLRRIISFLNPWDRPFSEGYQLTQSLVAFGRGKLLGQGIGNSVQKMFYLPESYTDFILSVIGEELGYIGVLLVLSLSLIIVFRFFAIAYSSIRLRRNFAGFVSVAFGTWWGLQSFINAGAAMGLLPTKGLTFPLVSYGGSSIVIMLTLVGIALRIDYENRCLQFHAIRKFNEL